MSITPWRATCIQMKSRIARVASSRAEAWPIISSNIDNALRLIDALFTTVETQPRLVLLPEFALQGPPRGETVDEWLEKACYPVPGPITEPLQRKARERSMYIAGNQFEMDPEWPHRHFNTSFLIGPDGELLLKYKRIHTAQWCSPHDFLDAFVQRHGVEGLFPVIETELGRLAMLACGEIMVPEMSRVVMLRGAEVLLHPTNEPITPGEEAAKVAAAAANMMFVVSTNVAGPIGFSDGEPMNGPTGRALQGGHSRIVDFDGTDLAFLAEPRESVEVSAVIDVEALREARRDLTMRNGLLRTRFEIFRPFYEGVVFYPANQFLREPMRHWKDTMEVGEKSLQNMVRQGVSRSADSPLRQVAKVGGG